MKKLVVLLIGMLALAGCPGGGKNSNNNLNGTVGLYGNCVGCGTTNAVFSQSVSSSLPQGVLTLSIAGDANQMNVWAGSGSNPLFSYQGPVSVSGTLVVNQGSSLPFGACQLPAGSYHIMTRQVGSYSAGTFQVPSIEIVSTSNANLRLFAVLSEGGILTDGNGSMTSFSALIFGQQGPNMMNYGAYNYNSYYNQGYGMMSNCGDTMGVRF